MRKLFLKYIFRNFNQHQAVDSWKEIILYTILFYLLLFNTFSYIIGVSIGLYFGSYLDIVFITFVYFSFSGIFLLENLSFRLRTYFLIGVTYFLGIGLMFIIENNSVISLLWLFSIPMLSAILLPARHLLVFILINASIILLAGINNYLVFQGIQLRLIDLFILLINFIVLELMIAMPITFLVNRFERIVKKDSRRIKILNAQNVALRQANQNLDRFVYSASHDLKAPIASIYGLLELNKLEKDDHMKLQYNQLMIESLNRLSNFIRNLSNYSRNTRVKLQISEVSIDCLINEALRDLNYLKEKDHITVRKRIEIHPPFYTDIFRLKLIMINILSNSINFRDKRRQCYINIEVKYYNDQLEIAVQDNGIGIAVQHLNKIFDMFYRANDHIYGSGLGLFITKEAIENIYGTIMVSSKIGESTTFLIKLPNLKNLRSPALAEKTNHTSL